MHNTPFLGFVPTSDSTFIIVQQMRLYTRLFPVECAIVVFSVVDDNSVNG